ncbi:serine/threonine-protein kinase VRK1 [Nomia melanderi]|uniref:serine/threonine-protein kinase VRK1 n=1 Tax=Nomia melanderi TaxID=2448451 RepID=UPI00130440A3|nr:serine/threonine-protein kinase VRK1-like [Nomia melanderi]
MCAEVKRAPKKKASKLYKMPDPISPGEILTDITKKQWILGKSIGIGGFGEVYSAAPYSGKTPKDYPNVIKIEPHGNGPLFVEMHFYMRNAKSDEIDNWRKKKKLSKLGMPPYIGSGSHEYKNIKYRFIVMERYGTDLWKLFKNNNKRFPEHTVYKIALQIMHVLEYIHFKTYVHADIKGGNLLLHSNSLDQVYLVDFGLASHYTKGEYKLDPKKAHNGTIEYTSRDAHMGVPTMRGDLEILGYNIIQWLCGSLLWEKDLSSPAAVQKQKEKAFQNIPEFLTKSFQGSVPNPVLKFMTLLASMKYNDVPAYDKFEKILTEGLKELSHKPDGKLEFKNSIHDRKLDILKSPNPPKVKKTTADKNRKSPRIRALKNLTPVRSLDDSTVGIIIDKKRGGVADLKQILNDIESDEEYDIKIVKKAKKNTDSVSVNKIKGGKTVVKNRSRVKAKNHDESISDSEPEIISKGSKSRPNSARKARTLVVHESASDDDMFDA